MPSPQIICWPKPFNACRRQRSMQLLQELGLPELQSSEWSFFGESTDIGRICSLALILLGLIGLRTFSGTARCGRKRIAQSLAQTPVC